VAAIDDDAFPWHVYQIHQRVKKTEKGQCQQAEAEPVVSADVRSDADHRGEQKCGAHSKERRELEVITLHLGKRGRPHDNAQRAYKQHDAQI